MDDLTMVPYPGIRLVQKQSTGQVFVSWDERVMVEPEEALKFALALMEHTIKARQVERETRRTQ